MADGGFSGTSIPLRGRRLNSAVPFFMQLKVVRRDKGEKKKTLTTPVSLRLLSSEESKPAVTAPQITGVRRPFPGSAAEITSWKSPHLHAAIISLQRCPPAPQQQPALHTLSVVAARARGTRCAPNNSLVRGLGSRLAETGGENKTNQFISSTRPMDVKVKGRGASLRDDSGPHLKTALTGPRVSGTLSPQRRA